MKRKISITEVKIIDFIIFILGIFLNLISFLMIWERINEDKEVNKNKEEKNEKFWFVNKLETNGESFAGKKGANMFKKTIKNDIIDKIQTDKITFIVLLK